MAHGRYDLARLKIDLSAANGAKEKGQRSSRLPRPDPTTKDGARAERVECFYLSLVKLTGPHLLPTLLRAHPGSPGSAVCPHVSGSMTVHLLSIISWIVWRCRGYVTELFSSNSVTCLSYSGAPLPSSSDWMIQPASSWSGFCSTRQASRTYALRRSRSRRATDSGGCRRNSAATFHASAAHLSQE